ncbi:hypothetical protein [Acetobacter orientalis]|uniref:hypothetical protein n=1 Tax=Acetobacter orientalis TaxID=146474 RepID=UPI0039EA17F0
MQPSNQQRQPLTHLEHKAILRIIKRVIAHKGATETRIRNRIYDVTEQLLRMCHLRGCALDLEAMGTAEIALVLEDLSTLRNHLNTRTGNLPYGQRLHFTHNVAFKKKPQREAA